MPMRKIALTKYQKVGNGRGVPTSLTIENESSALVSEQLARLMFAVNRIDFHNKRVLDFGCGTGYNVHYINNFTQPLSCIGFDISYEAIDFAKKRFPNYMFVVGDGLSHNLNLGLFDVVLCCEVIEHVLDQEQLLENVCRHLDIGGVLFISTPNKSVFSLGKPVPYLNNTHKKELTHDEFSDILFCLISGSQISYLHNER